MSFFDPLEENNKRTSAEVFEQLKHLPKFFYNIAGQAYFDTEEKCFLLRFSDNEKEDDKIKAYLKTMIQDGKNVDFVAIPGFPLKKIQALCSLIFCSFNFSPEWWDSGTLFARSILYDMDDYCMLNPLTNEFMKKLLLEKRTYLGKEYFLFNTESIIAMTLTYNMLIRDTELKDDPELTDLSLLIPQDRIEEILANHESYVPHYNYMVRKYNPMDSDYCIYYERKMNNGIGDNYNFSSLDGMFSVMSMREYLCLRVYGTYFDGKCCKLRENLTSADKKRLKYEKDSYKGILKKIVRGELNGKQLYEYMRARRDFYFTYEDLFITMGRDKFIRNSKAAPYNDEKLYSLDAMIDDPLMFYYTYCLGKYSSVDSTDCCGNWKETTHLIYNE